jgi:hypothetical protein
MDKPIHTEVEKCYDEMHRLWSDRIWMKGLLALLIFFVFTALGWMLQMQWLQVVSVIALGATLVVPQILRMHRLFSERICPSCGQSVGRYESNRSRIVLVCQHCSVKTPTDCAFGPFGGPPYKAD